MAADPRSASSGRYLTARSSFLPGRSAGSRARPATQAATSTLGACRPAPGRSSTTRARSPSPTAAVPATGPRTPCRRSRRPWRSATATSRPTCTSPPTGSCWRSTTTSSTGSPTAPAPSASCPGRWCSEARVDGREPIPLLEDLLGTWPDLRVNIDPKHDGCVDALVDVHPRAPAQHRPRVHRLLLRPPPGHAARPPRHRAVHVARAARPGPPPRRARYGLPTGSLRGGLRPGATRR